MTADRMIRFQPQKTNQANLSLQRRTPHGTLHAVKGCCHQHATAKGEDNRIGVKRTQTPERNIWIVKIQEWPCQFGGDIRSNERTHYEVDNCHDGKPAHNT